MPKKRKSKYGVYADAIVEFLGKYPWSNLKQLQAVINDLHATSGATHKVPSASALVYYVRSVYGEEVLVCDRRTNLYKIADTLAEGQVWVHGREKNIRNQLARTLQAVENLLAKRGPSKDLEMIRASLLANLTILDASIAGFGGGSGVGASTGV